MHAVLSSEYNMYYFPSQAAFYQLDPLSFDLQASLMISFAHNEDVLNSSVCRSTSCDLMRFTLYS